MYPYVKGRDPLRESATGGPGCAPVARAAGESRRDGPRPPGAVTGAGRGDRSRACRRVARGRARLESVDV